MENVNLYATKYEEEFQPYLQVFATAVWELLKASGTSAAIPKYDELITTSMRYGRPAKVWMRSWCKQMLWS